MNKMIYNLLLLLFPILILTGCYAVPRPKDPSDFKIQVNLKKGYHTSVGEQTCPTRGMYLDLPETSEGSPGVEEVIFVTMFNVAGDVFQIMDGTNVYIQPSGYPQYTQSLKWGKNIVYIPAELCNTQWILRILVKGWYIGENSVVVKPGTTKIKLTKSGEIRIFPVETARKSLDNTEINKPEIKILDLKNESRFKTETEKNMEVSLEFPADLNCCNDGGLLEIRLGNTESLTIDADKECVYRFKKKIIYERDGTEVSSYEEIYKTLNPMDDLLKSIHPKPGCIVRILLSIIEVREDQLEELGKPVITREFEYVSE